MKATTLSILIAFACLVSYSTKAQSIIDCDDDHKFYGVVRNRPLPAIPCDTMYLITKKNRQRIYSQEDQKNAIIDAMKQEMKLTNEKVDYLVQENDRHKKHIDSLNLYLNERGRQLEEMNALARRATENTDKALKIARTNKAIASATGVVAILSFVLLLLK